ncbi:MAG: hypothetical protein KF802_03670 [Bdellovibrionaceae bacterium]|nr:hypothetical protein [Pseudobdellovibrionaceae bacterium]MBX3033279.1 hypothetical protein [Pseudobdellovibrionaceae bacterium]
MKTAGFFFSLIFVLSFDAQAARTFQQCDAKEPGRTELDHFCPRVEGVHLEGCCPPLFKDPPIQCKYAVPVERGQAYLAKSSYTVCQGGTEVSVPCCQIRQRGCSRDPVTLPFKQRLLFRQKTCCFEGCPSADYWLTPPAASGITKDHELNSPLAQCTGTVIDECDAGNSANCQASDPCPVVPSPPNPPNPSPPGVPPPPGPTAPPNPSPPNPQPPAPQPKPPVNPGGA